MKIYLALLKPELKWEETKKKLLDREIEILDFYPALKVVKLRTSKKNPDKYLKEFFETMEEDKTDFSI